MTTYDFSTRPDGDVEVRKDGLAPYILQSNDTQLIDELLDRIRNEYTEAYNRLCEVYRNSMNNMPYFKYLVVRRFIKCNWSLYDNVVDIDNSGKFNLEYCQCPLRGECRDWKIICEPQKNKVLSPAEINVLRQIARGLENEDIADILHLSIHTVHNHRTNMLHKLGLHNAAALTEYWFKNNLK